MIFLSPLSPSFFVNQFHLYLNIFNVFSKIKKVALIF